MQQKHGTRGTGEVRREIRHSSPLPFDPKAEVEDLIERACARYQGAKALAKTEEVPWSYQWIRKMANDGDIPGLGQVLTFVRLAGPDDPFRDRLITQLDGLFVPTVDEIADRVVARLGSRPVQSEELRRLVVEELTPGRWVRR